MNQPGINKTPVIKRSKSLELTLSIIDKYKLIVGISRLADLTGLDYFNIPVFSAIRPNAKSLTVSQGKGLTEDEAKCSALIESIETYYAEEVVPDIHNCTVSEVNDKNLSYVSPNILNKYVKFSDSSAKLGWVKAKSFFEGKTIFIPLGEVSLDMTNSEIIAYASTSTGIGSGHNFTEAMLHGIFEVIERSKNYHKSKRLVVANHIPLVKLIHKNMNFQILQRENIFNIPVFECQIQSIDPSENQMIFRGVGCHANRNIALYRAIIESIQSRLTAIAGARDDIMFNDYIKMNTFTKLPDETSMQFEQITSIECDENEDYLKHVIHQLKEKNKDIIIYEYLNADLVILRTIIVDRSEISNAKW